MKVISGVQIFRYSYYNMNIVDSKNNKYTRVTFKIYRYKTGATSVDEVTVDPTSIVTVAKPAGGGAVSIDPTTGLPIRPR